MVHVRPGCQLVQWWKLLVNQTVGLSWYSFTNKDSVSHDLDFHLTKCYSDISSSWTLRIWLWFPQKFIQFYGDCQRRRDLDNLEVDYKNQEGTLMSLMTLMTLIPWGDLEVDNQEVTLMNFKTLMTLMTLITSMTLMKFTRRELWWPWWRLPGGNLDDLDEDYQEGSSITLMTLMTLMTMTKITSRGPRWPWIRLPVGDLDDPDEDYQ